MFSPHLPADTSVTGSAEVARREEPPGTGRVEYEGETERDPTAPGGASYAERNTHALEHSTPQQRAAGAPERHLERGGR